MELRRYEGLAVEFDSDAWINATEAATKFDRPLRHWLASADTKSYVEALKDNSPKYGEFIRTVEGRNGGTWLHPKLAVVFARWLSPKFAVWCDEQIASILRGVRQSPVRLADQMSIPHQKQNSRRVNSYQYRQGGVQAVIDHNRETQHQVTGMYPHEWRQQAKARGYKSKDYNSGKAAVRALAPAAACAVSLADEFTTQGHSLDKVAPIARQAIAIYDKMLEAGLQPGELTR